MPAVPPADPQSAAEFSGRAAAEREGRPFVLYTDGEGRQRCFCLESSSPSVSVGRELSCDLVLDWDDQVSRVHARLDLVGDGWELVDDGHSRNGTFLNEERLSGRRRLHDGDHLRFGRTPMSFRSPELQPSAPGNQVQSPGGVALSTTQRRVLGALCRPFKDGSRFASPATDQQIADELFLALGEVRTHLRVLCAKLGVEDLSRADTRQRLVERALSTGLISERDL